LTTTGVAGFPQNWIGRIVRHARACGPSQQEFRALLKRTAEAGATPNGVFGSIAELSELSDLRRWLPKAAGSDGASLAAGVPAWSDLRYVWITSVGTRNGGPDDTNAREDEEWRDYFSQSGDTPVLVSRALVNRDPARAATRLMRQLGVRLPGPVVE
jgi:LPS sulfotransferase NodH